jgi:hypothetical protein
MPAGGFRHDHLVAEPLPGTTWPTKPGDNFGAILLTCTGRCGMVERLAALRLRHRVFGKWQLGRRALSRRGWGPKGWRGVRQRLPLVKVGGSKYSGRN